MMGAAARFLRAASSGTVMTPPNEAMRRMSGRQGTFRFEFPGRPPIDDLNHYTH
jgi:hypothetical protein